jgi:ABC-2 type transport system ATP-binding protein
MEQPIQIRTQGLGKKYGSNRLFKDLDLSFDQPGNYAITGFNGSGKSTLLLCLAGFITPSEGRVWWAKKDRKNMIKDQSGHFAFCSPALNLFEDLTLEEHLNYHKKFVRTFNIDAAKNDIKTFALTKSLNKQILSFSSGMKQRLKLILALNNDVPVIFLDEPCSNLDETGVLIYQNLIQNRQENNLVIIATNQAGIEFPLKGTIINLDKA